MSPLPKCRSSACLCFCIFAWPEYSGTAFGVGRSVKVDDKVQMETGAVQSDHLFHKYVLYSSCLTKVGEVSVIQCKHILWLGILYKLEVWNLVIIYKICKLKSWSIQMNSLPVCSENLMHCKFARVSNIVPKSSLGFFFWDSLHHKHTIFKIRYELIHLHILLFPVWGCRSVPDFTFIYFLLIFISLLFGPVFQSVKIIQSLGLELCSIRYPFQLCHSRTWKRVFIQKADKMLKFIQALGPMAGSLTVCNRMIKTRWGNTNNNEIIIKIRRL